MELQEKQATKGTTQRRSPQLLPQANENQSARSTACRQRQHAAILQPHAALSAVSGGAGGPVRASAQSAAGAPAGSPKPRQSHTGVCVSSTGPSLRPRISSGIRHSPTQLAFTAYMMLVGATSV